MKSPLTREEKELIIPLIREFAGNFQMDPGPFIDTDYVKITPASSRPFANKYTWE